MLDEHYEEAKAFRMLGTGGEHVKEDVALKSWEATICTIFATVLFTFFVLVELSQFYKHGILLHMSDFWNWIDVTSLIFNAIFIFSINMDLHASEVFTMNTLRLIGSVTAFLMWIKTFYWMRLFKTSASFITLILATFNDILMFMFIVFLMISAFANFFYILNKNTLDSGDGDDSYRYVVEMTENGVINAYISMYLLTLGEFSALDGY